MKRVAWEWILITVLLITVFTIRLDLSLETTELTYESYTTVRAVEHLLETRNVLSEDELSVLSSVKIRSVFFDYFLAFFVLLFEDAFKIVPNLFSTLLILPVYFLTKRLTKKRRIAFLASILTSMSPFVFGTYLNTVSTVPLVSFLILTILAMLHNTEKYLYPLLICIIILTFLSPLVFVFIFAICSTIALLKLERFSIDKKLQELLLFSSVLGIWFHIIQYKDVLFAGGVRALWRNLPASFSAIYYPQLSALDILYGVGVVSFLFGVLGMNQGLFENRNKQTLPLIGTILSIFILLLFRVLELKIGLFLIAPLLSILAAQSILFTYHYLERTNFPWVRFPLFVAVAILFIFTAILPSLSTAQKQLDSVPSQTDIRSFRLMQVPEEAVLLTTLRESAAVQYFAEQKTLSDTEFLLFPKGNELVNDIDSIYTSRFVTALVQLSEKWNIQYILFTSDAKKQYARDGLQISDSECLEEQRAGNNTIYEVLC
jgi:hypothetical protein